MSKFETKETTEENINRLKGYYNNPENGMNKCFILQRIKELENNLK